MNHDYGFINCASQEEISWLLGHYQGLIKINNCNLFKLHKACMAGKLYEFIRNDYEKNKADSFYYQWFLGRPEIVKNRYPLTAAGTETEETTPKPEEK